MHFVNSDVSVSVTCSSFLTTLPYKYLAFSFASSHPPPITLGKSVIYSKSFPGMTRSNENTKKKSEPLFKPLPFSKIGSTMLSVVPGATVDSIMIVTPFFMCFDIFFDTSFNDSYLGTFLSSTGV